MAVQITGEKVTDGVYIRINGETYRFQRNITPFQSKAEINPGEYTLVNKGKLPYLHSDQAISMIQSFYGLKSLDANVRALTAGLKVPSPSIFMPHYVNVNEALQGRSVLYDASGNLIEGDRLEKYSSTLNSDCWVHLNAGFPKESEKGTGFLDLDLAVITGLDAEGKPVISRMPLEDCLGKNCWADLELLNSQGLPTRASRIGRYIPGKVIYFTYPTEDSVARFDANPGWTYLNCNRNPRDSNTSLGVFLCAEGTQNSETH